MTYGDLILIVLGMEPLLEAIDPRIKKLTIADCLDHHPDDVIIFDEEVNDNVE